MFLKYTGSGDKGHHYECQEKLSKRQQAEGVEPMVIATAAIDSAFWPPPDMLTVTWEDEE